MEKRFPFYLSQPYKILWFEPDDMVILVAAFLLGMAFTAWFFLGFFMVWPYIKIKRHYPRGFLRHALYFLGLIQMKGYPTYFHEDFNE
ncbi:type IV conjugative transfer system protein TraL [Geoalkalibacter halelectricus]|uniref:type IV conjugative transfer system protein TraL n=1 Tax=Geoalkalibacter halelectricus TaxID=2847045 RepID=UPI00266EA35B|nr:type IV conjugative transfer system protein TraL [Geoalkalibacter halelectricus]MDO3380357.1 type IV conjugative transfer system protein TraL [Geoalkalibacter halelectricus]